MPIENAPEGIAQVLADYVRMYYEHQYDRIATLEQQSLTITNIVISISVLALTFGFSGAPNSTPASGSSSVQGLSPIAGLALPTAMIIANLFAIGFVLRTSSHTRVHKRRAKAVLKLYASGIFQLDDSMQFPTKGTWWGREKIVLSIHGLLVLVSLFPIFLYLLKTL
jgi:amino acid transporter